MKAPLILLVLILAVPARAVPIGEPVEWPISEGGNGHYYELYYQLDVGWATGHYYAATRLHNGLRGHLVTITSQQENFWIEEVFLPPLVVQPIPVGGSWWFIGGWNDGIDLGEHRQWRWITGEVWGYENWAPGEPSAPDFEYGLSLLYDWPSPTGSNLFGFNDVEIDRNHTYGFIIEYDGLECVDLPPGVGNPVTEVTHSWGTIKSLYR